MRGGGTDGPVPGGTTVRRASAVIDLLACTDMPERQRTQRPPIDLAEELERAVERNEFGLEYQPIIDLGSGSIAAVEALLRWRHPLMGTIAPAEYLPLAEETGLIVPIGERVLDAATRQLRTWHLGFARMQSLRVNVNISPRQLSRPRAASAHIHTVLQRSDLDPSSLTLELGTGCSEYPGPHRGPGRRSASAWPSRTSGRARRSTTCVRCR